MICRPVLKRVSIAYSGDTELGGGLLAMHKALGSLRRVP